MARFAMVWLAVASGLMGCAVTPPEPIASVDERSGVSITVVDRPLVLARERRDVAVHARDYLTLLAAEINDSGRRRLVWVVHQWSTIDARTRDFEPAPGATLLLVADGRDMRLNPVNNGEVQAWIRNPGLAAPDDSDAVTTVYSADDMTLEFVANSTHVAAVFPESRLTLPFTLWQDGRAALLRLLRAIR